MAARTSNTRKAEIREKDAAFLLQQAGSHPEALDEAYAAMRDLEIEANILTLQEDGSLSSTRAQGFGVGNRNFNPVFEASNDIDRRVQQEARAPCH